ncbi:MAG TPA: hemerythrin domain-containing protein [Cyclobacteriaceae bacterium]|nr:hemerythrin domain-containing protein [Cyclobacteriaceae bacterium]
MKNVLEYMGNDHDRLDNILAEFRKTWSSDQDKAKSLFFDFKIGLQRHIVWEEEILFPIFEDKTGMNESGPTAVMRMEHRQIKDFLEEIYVKITSGKTDEIESLVRKLLEVLVSHNQKEEMVLYPWIDRQANDEEIEEVFEKIENLPLERYN